MSMVQNTREKCFAEYLLDILIETFQYSTWNQQYKENPSICKVSILTSPVDITIVVNDTLDIKERYSSQYTCNTYITQSQAKQ